MPEIGEVARIVHYLRKHVVGKTISAVKTQEDEIVYGKVGTSASAFASAMKGKKVLDARQQGKYFWMVMSSPPHPLMHFGMTGWMKFSNDSDSVLYSSSGKQVDEQWPPKFWKFTLELEGEPRCETAFVDSRRLGRIRLVDVEADKMRDTTPLKENGPDPVIDKDILTKEWLAEKMRSKKTPIKALLLDQANISGVGNWVADEVLYQARIHPEQFSNTFSDEQIQTLHDSLRNVCTIAVDTKADSSLFPDNWLMPHRWSKGKKGKERLPNGEKIVFLKVGGRTSAVIPSVQKKTGAVAADIPENEDESDGSEEQEQERTSQKRSRKDGKSASNGTKETASSPPKTPQVARTKNGPRSESRRSTGKAKASKVGTPPTKKRKTTTEAPKNEQRANITKAQDSSGRRKSARLSKG